MTHLAAVNSTLVFAQESNETMSLYSNPGANFEINYPSSWEKREFPAAENSSIIEFLGPSTGVEPRTPSVNVFIFPAGNQTVEQAVNEVIDELEDIQVNSTTMKLNELNVTARVLEVHGQYSPPRISQIATVDRKASKNIRNNIYQFAR